MLHEPRWSPLCLVTKGGTGNRAGRFACTQVITAQFIHTLTSNCCISSVVCCVADGGKRQALGRRHIKRSDSRAPVASYFAVTRRRPLHWSSTAGTALVSAAVPHGRSGVQPLADKASETRRLQLWLACVG